MENNNPLIDLETARALVARGWSVVPTNSDEEKVARRRERLRRKFHAPTYTSAGRTCLSQIVKQCGRDSSCENKTEY